MLSLTTFFILMMLPVACILVASLIITLIENKEVRYTLTGNVSFHNYLL